MNRKRIFKIAVITLMIFLFLFIFWYSYSQKQKDPITASAFKLDTFVEISIYDSKDKDLLNSTLDLCDYYEKIFSRTDSHSELYQLNHRTLPKKGQAYQVSPELKELIQKGLFYSQLSQGHFDITIAPVSSLWDFTSDDHRLPDQEQLEKAVAQVGWEQVTVTADGIVFDNDQVQIDLGGIAKGYIADQIKEDLMAKGVKSAVINLGGNVLCIGQKNSSEDFKVGIQKPFANRNETAGVISVNDQSVVSSGIYERGFEQKGVWYHHILDPSTGYPYQNGLIAVTILSDASVDGDALSTICFSLGLEEGMKLIDSLEQVSALFITSDYKLHPSENFPPLS